MTSCHSLHQRHGKITCGGRYRRKRNGQLVDCDTCKPKSDTPCGLCYQFHMSEPEAVLSENPTEKSQYSILCPCYSFAESRDFLLPRIRRTKRYIVCEDSDDTEVYIVERKREKKWALPEISNKIH